MKTAIFGSLFGGAVTIVIYIYFFSTISNRLEIEDFNLVDAASDFRSNKWTRIRNVAEHHLKLFSIETLHNVSFQIARPSYGRYAFKQMDLYGVGLQGTKPRFSRPLKCRTIFTTVETFGSDYSKFERSRLSYIAHHPLDCMLKIVVPSHDGIEFYGLYAKVISFLLMPPLISAGAIVLRRSGETDQTVADRRERIYQNPLASAVPDDLLPETPWILAHDADIMFTNPSQSLYAVTERIQRALRLPVLLPQSSPPVNPDWLVLEEKFQWAIAPDWNTWRGKHQGFNSGVQLYKPGMAIVLVNGYIGIQFLRGRAPEAYDLKDQGWYSIIATSVFGIHNISNFCPCNMTEDEWLGKGPNGDYRLLAIGYFTSDPFEDSDMKDFDSYLSGWNTLEGAIGSSTTLNLVTREQFSGTQPVIMAVLSGRWINSLAPGPPGSRQPNYAYWHPGDFVFHAAGIPKKDGFLRYSSKTLKELQRNHTIPTFESFY